MKRLGLSLLAVVALTWARVAVADQVCTPVAPWVQSWTDAFLNTTYTITAPDCVYLTVPFDVTISATDANPANAEAMVGGAWSVIDNGVEAEAGGYIWLTAGSWSRTFTWTYTGVPVNHTIQFAFKDFGEFGSSFHGTNVNLIGGVTVDPFPPGTEPPVEPPPVEPPPVEPPPVDPPVVDPPATDPVTDPVADPATGCSTGGGEAGLLALIALALGARRRRA